MLLSISITRWIGILGRGSIANHHRNRFAAMQNAAWDHRVFVDASASLNLLCLADRADWLDQNMPRPIQYPESQAHHFEAEDESRSSRIGFE